MTAFISGNDDNSRKTNHTVFIYHHI